LAATADLIDHGAPEEQTFVAAEALTSTGELALSPSSGLQRFTPGVSGAWAT
jgi:hypothetical protein